LSSIIPLEKLTTLAASSTSSFLQLVGQMAANTPYPIFIFNGSGVLVTFNKDAAHLLFVEFGMTFSTVLVQLKLEIAEQGPASSNGGVLIKKNGVLAGTFHEIISGDEKIDILSLFE